VQLDAVVVSFRSFRSWYVLPSVFLPARFGERAGELDAQRRGPFGLSPSGGDPERACCLGWVLFFLCPRQPIASPHHKMVTVFRVRAALSEF